MNKLKDHVKTLARAEVVAFGGVGIAGQTLPETAAYFALADEVARDARAVRPHLDRLLKDATPAGRVYAATLLTTAGPAHDRVHRRADDRRPVRGRPGRTAELA